MKKLKPVLWASLAILLLIAVFYWTQSGSEFGIEGAPDGTSESSTDGNATLVDLGRGWNRLEPTDKICGTCVDFTRPVVDTTESASVTFDLQYTETLEQFKNQVETNFGSRASWSNFAVEFDRFASSQVKMSSFNQYLVLVVMVKYPPSQSRANRLNALGMTYVSSKDGTRVRTQRERLNAFVKNCGTEYFDAVVSGGSFVAIVKLEASNKLQFDSLRQALDVQYGEIANLSESKITALLSVENKILSQVSVKSFGGDQAKLVPSKVRDVISRAQAFPGEVRKYRIPLYYALKRYVGIEGVPQELLDDQKLRKVIEKCDESDLGLSDIGEYIGNIGHIENFPSEFTDEARSMIETEKRKALGNLDKLVRYKKELYEYCFSGSSSEPQAPNLEELKVFGRIANWERKLLNEVHGEVRESNNHHNDYCAERGPLCSEGKKPSRLEEYELKVSAISGGVLRSIEVVCRSSSQKLCDWNKNFISKPRIVWSKDESSASVFVKLGSGKTKVQVLAKEYSR